uniref:histidine kinase n=1 Tax=Eutreptiella gymnastica TaxID=73025 RepID=A0A7S1JE79_9EUGL
MLALVCTPVLRNHLPTETAVAWITKCNSTLTLLYTVNLVFMATKYRRQSNLLMMLDLFMIICLVSETLLLVWPIMQCRVFDIIVQCKTIAVCPRLLDMYDLCCKSGRAETHNYSERVDDISAKVILVLVLLVLLTNLDLALWSDSHDAAAVANAMLVNNSSHVGTADTFVPCVNAHDKVRYLCFIFGVILVVLSSNRCLAGQINAMLALQNRKLGMSQTMAVWQVLEDAEEAHEIPNVAATIFPVVPHFPSRSTQTPPMPDNNVPDFFLNAMSHELRTPHATAMNTVELLLELEPMTPHRKLLEDIYVGSFRGLTQVSTIILYAELLSGRVKALPVHFDIVKLVEATIQSLRRAYFHTRIRFETGIEVSEYVGDESKLQHVLLQVLLNAIVHNPDDTTVAVSVSLATGMERQHPWQDEHAVERSADGPHLLLIEVEDQGVGMPPDYNFDDAAFRPFNSFRQGSRRGTSQGCGLGLYVAKLLVELLGGSIKVTFPDRPRGTSSSTDYPITPLPGLLHSPQPDSPSCAPGPQNASCLLSGPWGAEEKQPPRPGTRVSIRVPLMPRQIMHRVGPDDTRSPQLQGVGAVPPDLVQTLHDVHTTPGPRPLGSHRPGQSTGDEGNRKLDRYPEPGIGPSDTVQRAKPGSGTFPVLVVEDTPTIARALSAQLQHLGCRVTICNNGQEALQHLDSSPGAWYALIIMDYHMPVMDGIHCTQAIRRLEEEGRFLGKPAMYIQGLSADVRESTCGACLAAGMSSFSSKPMPIDGLRALVDSQRGNWAGSS